mmetsp:Transcript_50708/g.147627  ORF Transcript_50708/g.147627 Transcript_50708/m.147627 type:complete len:376 (-) Transcript_50708:211-1338(-)
MKLSSAVVLVLSVAPASGAFLRPTENAPSSRSARGMTTHGIDLGYLQNELANFCNEKLVGGSLVPTLPSMESSTGSMLVAEAITNPMTIIQEKALEWLNIGTAAISQSLLEFSSSIQPSVVSDMTAVVDPNLLVPSLIMLASMTITVAVPSKATSSPIQEMPQVSESSFPLEAAIQTTGSAILTPVKQPSYDLSASAVLAASTVGAPVPTMAKAAEVAASSESSVLVREDFAIENHSEVLQGETTTIVCCETPVPLKRATTVMTTNSRAAVPSKVKSSQVKQPQQQQQLQQTATNILDSLILKVTRWFVQSLRLVRVTAFVQSLVPFWRARRAEEAKLYKDIRANTRTTWLLKMAQSSLARVKELLTRPLRQRLL